MYSRGVAENSDLVASPAATVVVMRGSNGGLEVLLLRRSSQLAFYGGAWVFPGGRIDAQDGDPAQEPAARAAAVRELREESGLELAPQALVPFARWITPPGRPRRFDTWYFAARAPHGAVRVDAAEVDAHRWMRPEDALAARAEGKLELPPPTFVTLAQLALHADPDAALHALGSAPLQRYVPRPCEVANGTVYLYEGDVAYTERAPAMQGARHRLTALADGWRYERSE